MRIDQINLLQDGFFFFFGINYRSFDLHLNVYQARFFGASPEQDLAHNMNALLGIAEGASGEGGNSTYRDPPWVWCCLRSYYLEESDPWGTRRYRICDTELVG